MNVAKFDKIKDSITPNVLTISISISDTYEYKQVYKKYPSIYESIFKYLFLVNDFRSRYFYDKQKLKKAQRDTELKDTVVNDPIVIAASDTWRAIVASIPTLAAIDDFMVGVEALRKYARSTDFTEVIQSGPQKGKPVNDPMTLVKVTENFPKLIKVLNELEKTALEQLAENEYEALGNRQIGYEE
jgi:hydroxypyruvate isomerase